MPATNWQEFQRELKADFQGAVIDEYQGLRTEMVEEATRTMDQLVPRRTGKLASTIAVSVGREDKGARGGVLQAVLQLAVTDPFDTIFVMVNSPLASLVERGTVHMPPKPFFRPAIEGIRNRERRV